MLVSIFTPSHNTQHLAEAYRSLENQDHAEWEWIIGLNGDAKLPEDECFRRDARIKPFHTHVSEANIGALKFACCQRAQGEALVELDHDDLLWPGVLQKIVGEIVKGADFVYSDAASFDEEKNRPVWYSSDHGWETYPVKLYGRDLVATRNFAVTPRSLCEVYYAPDHVRAWKRAFYHEIGGHDVTLAVGDDHDLICRSYLAHGKFAHTGGVGYVYRYHQGNTVKERQDAIRRQMNVNRNKYLHPLIDEWVGREKLGYLDLNRHVEWFNDMPDLSNVRDSSVGCINAANNSLQFVATEKVPTTFEHFHRVLAPSGWLCCRVYSTSGPGGFLPCAKSYWNFLSFDYFCDKNLALPLQPYRGRFQKLHAYERYADPEKEEPFKKISVYADLCAIKEQRQPGPVLI